MSEYSVFKLNDVITAHDDTPLITSLTQIYLSQVTTVYDNHLAIASFVALYDYSVYF